jgi:hypothetical protein
MPQVSVIIPTYNAERTILDTIASVQQQTFCDFELVVINDGSTDRTPELLDRVADKRLNIFSYENGGLPVARNRGIFHSTGEFIAFLDADDLWTADKLELQLAALQKSPETGVAYSWTCSMYDKEDSLSFNPCTPVFFEGNVHAELLLSNFIGSGSNALIRRQAIESVGDFDPSLKSSEDWDYWLRLSACWLFALVPKYQVLYRRSSGSMSSKVEVMKEETFRVLEKAYQAAPPELQYLKTQSIIKLHQYYADLHLQHCPDITGLSQAGQNLWRVISLCPQTLLERNTQKLLLKFLLRRVLPPGVDSYLIQQISKTRTIPDPRFSNEKFLEFREQPKL